MAQMILMPALSPTMTEGTLANWLVKEGDPVESGQVIAEIETDKATMEVEAVDEGVIAKILIEAGAENVAVNSPIAILAEEGESAEQAINQVGGQQQTPPPSAVATPTQQSDPVPQQTQSNSPATINSSSRIFVSPLAKRLATEQGLALDKITGTGSHGRIIKRDIEHAIASGGAKQTSQAAQETITVEAESTLKPMNNMRKTIARRLVEAKQTVPHFYLSRDVCLDDLLKARQQLNAKAEMSDDGKPAYKLSVNDLIIKACAQALIKVPETNATYEDNAVRYYHRADISIAVATDGGLITPVIRGADGLGLIAISNQMKELASRARAGKLMPEEYQGGAFTISNLGMYGIEQFQAIINPPQASILAVGAGIQKPVVVNDEMVIRTMMTLTLSVDHRVVDGALGAQYLEALSGFIEQPITLLA